jgi:hypothetical protein
MFRLNLLSSDVQVVMGKDSSAHCSAVFFPPIVVASGYFGYVGYTWLLLVLQCAAESLTITTCTPEDGQLGRNM